MVKMTILCALLAALAGCAARGPDLSESQRAELERPLDCDGAEACSKLWRRAQIWVAENAGYKIQVATDAVIETFNATSGSTRFAMRVVRIPRAGTREELQLSLSCGDFPLCGISKEKMAIRFKRELRD